MVVGCSPAENGSRYLPRKISKSNTQTIVSSCFCFCSLFFLGTNRVTRECKGNCDAKLREIAFPWCPWLYTFRVSSARLPKTPSGGEKKKKTNRRQRAIDSSTNNTVCPESQPASDFNVLSSHNESVSSFFDCLIFRTSCVSF